MAADRFEPEVLWQEQGGRGNQTAGEGKLRCNTETTIIEQEERLRAWFTRDADAVLQVVDGLDIGWGGSQRWATARMPPVLGPHLDFACGYGTFMAQLGWRSPGIRLVGLNLDYAGPHALIRELLARAGVQAELVQADARQMPFVGGAFSSASCFLGLQDIEIGFGEAGVRAALAEAGRILCPGGLLTLLDEFTFPWYDSMMKGLPFALIDRAERSLNTRWDRQVAERAIALYAEGWVAQARPGNAEEAARMYDQTHRRMAAEMERQLRDQGYYVPFGPLRMVVAQKAI